MQSKATVNAHFATRANFPPPPARPFGAYLKVTAHKRPILASLVAVAVAVAFEIGKFGGQVEE